MISIARWEHNKGHCNTLQHWQQHIEHTETRHSTYPRRWSVWHVGNTRKDTATHCNTPQHTAIHRSTYQRRWSVVNGRNTSNGTATHGNILQHTATYCNTPHCNTPHHIPTEMINITRWKHHKGHCNTLQHATTHCKTLQHIATHYNTLQHAATHCNAPQHTATHCNTPQHIPAEIISITRWKNNKGHRTLAPCTHTQYMSLLSGDRALLSD